MNDVRNRIKLLIGSLRSGDPEQMEKTANLICEKRITECAPYIVSLLDDSKPLIRGIAVIILGVLGYKEGKIELKRLKNYDEVDKIRIAAMIALKHFGKITYETLKNEIGTYKGSAPSLKLKQKVKTEKKNKKRRIVRKKHEKPHKVKTTAKNQRWIATAFILAGVFVLLFYLWQRGKEPFFFIRGNTIAEKIQRRLTAASDFKQNYLDPNNPMSKSPMTISLSTFSGDTYYDIAVMVYSSPVFERVGINTLIAFWRKHNFPDLKTEQDPNLLEQETQDEVLIFPNYSAMRLNYDLIEGSVAYESIFDSDPDVFLNVVVDDVIIE